MKTKRLTESKELAILNRISTTLSKSLELDTVLDVALDESLHALRVNNGGIYLYNPMTGKLTLRVQHNLTDSFIKAKSVVGPGEGCTGTAYDTKQIFSGYGTPEKVYICADAQELMGIDCLAAAPILFKNEVLGVLEMFAPVDRKLTRREINLLNAICNQIGVAVANANSHEALKHALKDSRLLLEASEAIVSSLKLDEILERLINLASELTHISRAAIWLLSLDKNLVLSHNFETLPAGYGFNLGELFGPLGKAIREKATFTIRDFSDSASVLQQMAKQFSIKSLLVVPMVFHDRVLGLLTLDKPGIDHTFTKDEIELAEGIARQAAIAIENAQTYEEQRAIAETLQKSFLPVETPKAKGYEIGVRYESASIGALVGGDFYDFVNLGDNIGIAIGDVSGKGVEAATLTGMVKNTIRVLALEGMTPAALVAKTNNLITRQVEKNQFITLFFGMLDLKSGELIFTNAGHPPGLLFNADKRSIGYLGRGNPPIGIFFNQSFDEQKASLNTNDCLLLYTDGVTEARQNSNIFGEKRLEKLFFKSADRPVDYIAGQILQKVEEFNRGHLTDDIALIVVKRQET